jgi:alpha-beta hydrolase superfamily lysophospholipase
MKCFFWILGVITGLYGMICVLVFIFQEKLVFFPEILPHDYSFRFSIPFTEHYFKPDTSTTIHALHFRVPKPQGVVFYFHGNMGSLRTWGGVSSIFVELGYDVLIYDYRGFGKSRGRMSEHAMFSDSLFIYHWLEELYGEDKIVILGRSIGSGIAVFLAAQNKPGRLILEAPFYSMRDLVRHRCPWLPDVLLRYPFRSDMYIKEVTCPFIIFHGTADTVIYHGSSVKLMQHAKEGDRLCSITGGHHNNLQSFEEYRNNLVMFLKQ